MSNETKTVYQLDRHHCYLCTTVADRDPLDENNWLIPAGCVEVAPPAARRLPRRRRAKTKRRNGSRKAKHGASSPTTAAKPPTAPIHGSMTALPPTP